MKTINLASILLFFYGVIWSQNNINVNKAHVEINDVIIDLNNNSKISLKFLDSKNIKFWFSKDGEFKRNNKSFAVINEVFEKDFKVNIEESTSMYEVFTGDIRVMIYKSPFKIQIYNKYQRLIMGDDNNSPYQVEGTQIKTNKILRQDEHFFGLGEKTGALDRRGNSYTMWNSDKPCYSDSEDPLYKSIPFFISSYKYGVFLDNTYKTEFDFGKTDQNSFSFSTPEGPFVYYFMYGKDYKEILKTYVKLTGQPIMPPKWALGWSQSRGVLTTEELTRNIAEEYRKRNIPCDIIYQDIGWVEGLQNFEWRKENYNNPKQMLSDLKTKGFKVIVSQDPVVSQATNKQWSEANANGYFVKDKRTNKSYDMPWPWGGNAGVVDFTLPEVANWWGVLQQKPINDGVKGFWTDMGEPAWSNEESTDRLNMVHHLGFHNEIHNVYGLTWDKVVTEQFEKHNPNQRIFQMTRAAYAGLQRYTFGWSGDSGNGEDVNAGWKNLANQIPLGLSAGLGVIPFWTTDISGYCGDIKDYNEFSELYVRWLQFGVFNPLSRAHHEGNNAVEPWLFGAEAEKLARQAIELKYKLHPYIYTYARKAYDTGLPIMRALVLEYPNDEKTFSIDDQFLLGKELLIAPVVKQGAKYRDVYLPKGEWIDYYTGNEYSGEQLIKYPVELSTIPIFAIKGAIITKSPVMQFIDEIKNAPVNIEIFPSEKKTSFELYEDDGLTNDYKINKFSKTLIEAQKNENTIRIDINKPLSTGYKSEIRNYLLEIHVSNKVKKIMLNGKKVKTKSKEKLEQSIDTKFNEASCSFSKKEKVIWIKIPDNKQNNSIEISL